MDFCRTWTASDTDLSLSAEEYLKTTTEKAFWPPVEGSPVVVVGRLSHNRGTHNRGTRCSTVRKDEGDRQLVTPAV